MAEAGISTGVWGARARTRAGWRAGRQTCGRARITFEAVHTACILLALHVSLRNRSEIAKGAPGGLRAVIFAMVVTLWNSFGKQSHA